MKIILTGGGTIGSVSPLIAVAEELTKQIPSTLSKRGDGLEFLWIGTKTGPERQLVENYKIPFKAISSGKLRRYFSLGNFFDFFKLIAGFFQSIVILRKFKPDLVLGAGGFVGVPVIWAAWILGIKSLAHQQDIRPSLSNRLVAGRVKKITVTFEESRKFFSKGKTVLTGNPVRAEIFEGSREQARQFFHLEEGLPTVLVLGGGTGSLILNKIIAQSLKNLLGFLQVIHITGMGKGIEGIKSDKKSQREFKKIIAQQSSYLGNPRYHYYEFLINEMKDAYAAADLVISRAGMGALSELSVLGKPTILIPLLGHQEENAAYYKKNNAALIMNQKDLTPESLVSAIKALISNPADLNTLSRNISKMMERGAGEKMAKVVLELLKE